MKVLGVDIGTYEVKTVLLDAGLARTQLTAAAAYGVGDGPLEALLTEATRGNFDLVAVSVDRRAVMTRTLTLPFQDPVQLAKVVPFEAESQLPFTAEKGYIDHFVIEAGKPEGTEVLVFAISHKDFEQQRTLWSGVQHPDAVHQVDSFAGVNALLTLGAIPDGTVAVVDLGHSKTCVEILRARRLAFSRCLSNGGESLTRALAVARGLSPADADALKRQGLASGERGTGTADAGPEAGRLESAAGNTPAAGGAAAVSPLAAPRQSNDDLAVLRPFLDKLASELRFTFLSYQSTKVQPVTQVLLTGGGGASAGLAAQLSGRLGLPVTPIGSLKLGGLPAEVASDLGRFVTAYGVALAGASCISPLGAPKGHIIADFLKEGRSFWKYHRRKISAAVTGILVLALAFAVWQFVGIQRLKSEVAAVEARVKGELAQVNKDNATRGRKKIAPGELEAAVKEAQRRLGLLKRPVTSNVGILNEVSRLVPRTLSFTIRAFAIESGLVTLEAETGSNDNADSITEALKLSRVFEGVRKTESGPLPENPARVLFKIQFKTKG